MENDEWKKRIKIAKDSYYKIGAVPCPAFGGELVYFNRHGWNHLFRKGRFPRNIEEQRKRVQLLKYAPPIIRVVSKLADHEVKIQDKLQLQFWAAHHRIDGLKIRIIICQRDVGRKFFLSIMEESR